MKKCPECQHKLNLIGETYETPNSQVINGIILECRPCGDTYHKDLKTGDVIITDEFQ